ncbi:hypothetical protein [Gilvimarinus japonicus]|uniref:Uncharacterized protein n=1 Tax=Gilvimarinus japonicus TaxID=1796469 RepID=A0ABV7HWF1_9GAMM
MNEITPWTILLLRALLSAGCASANNNESRLILPDGSVYTGALND